MNKIRVRVRWNGNKWIAEARSCMNNTTEVEVTHYKNGFSGDDETGDFTRIIWHIKQRVGGVAEFVTKSANPPPLQIYHLDAAGNKNFASPAESDSNPGGTEKVFQNLRRVDSNGDGVYEKLTIDVHNKNSALVGSGLFRKYAYSLNMSYRDSSGTSNITIDPMISNYAEYD